ncbi:MAG: hypothetical protein QXL15_00400 [Candidatus Korarchaeota archaeon]
MSNERELRRRALDTSGTSAPSRTPPTTGQTVASTPVPEKLTINCPSCGAELTILREEMLHTCEYCGYSFTVRDRKPYKVFMLKVNYSQDVAFRYMTTWIKKQLGVPPDFESKSSLKKSELIFYPFWIASSYAYTKYSGYGRDAEFYNPVLQRPGAYWNIRFIRKPESWFAERDYEHYMVGAPAPPQIADYKFSARARQYFDINEVKSKSGKLLQSNMDLDRFTNLVRSFVYNSQTQEILKEIEIISTRDDKIDLREAFMVYLPVYHFEYEYNSKRYGGYVDASSGVIIWANAPVRKSTRTLLSVLGGLGTAGGIYLIVRYIIPMLIEEDAFVWADFVQWFFLAYFAFVFGGIALYRAITTGRATEKLKEKEDLFAATYYSVIR